MFVPALRSFPNTFPNTSSNLSRAASMGPAASAASSAQSASSSSSTTTSDPTSGLDTMFLQLLSAQLQNQSPLNPLDPNQFVAQLAQFQSLSELTQIDSYMQTLVGDLTGASSASGSAQAAATSSNAAAHTNPISTFP